MMSERSFQSVLDSLNNTSRRAFDAVPLQEPWTVNQITAEMRRTGTPQEARTVVGILSKLVDLGVVKEPAKGTFIRAQFRAATAPSAQQEIPVSQPAKPTPATSFSALAAMGSKLRGLSEQCAKLAKEADELAIQLEEEKEKQRETAADVLALQALIKKIGGAS